MSDYTTGFPSADITPDEPYTPSTGNGADDQEIQRETRAESQPRIDPAKATPWKPPQGSDGRSLLPPLDADFSQLVACLEKKLESGRVLSPRELQILTCHGALRLVSSRRPSVAAAGVRVLAKLNQQKRLEKEARKKRSAQRKRQRRELEGLPPASPPQQIDVPKKATTENPSAWMSPEL